MEMNTKDKLFVCIVSTMAAVNAAILTTVIVQYIGIDEHFVLMVLIFFVYFIDDPAQKWRDFDN